MNTVCATASDILLPCYSTNNKILYKSKTARFFWFH